MLKIDYFFHFLSLLLFFEFIKNECLKGCISCSPASRNCTICDTTSGYIPSNNTCILAPIENCALVSINRFCLVCNQNYILENGRCFAKTAQLQNSCSIFQASPACSLNKTGIFYVDMIYYPKTISIPNCEIMIDTNLCKKCDIGYILSIDKKKCISNINLDQNCMFFTEYKCKKCRKGHFHSKNNYLLGIYDPETLDVDNFMLSYYSSINDNNDFIMNNCLRTNGTNCAIFLSQYQCEVCEEGFVMDMYGRCITINSNVVNHCQKYDYKLNCIKCLSPYYLSANQLCEIIPIILNCLIYNTSSASPNCIECTPSYYIGPANGTANGCVLRVLSSLIPFCYTYAKNSDTCLFCGENYLLTPNNLSCVLSLENCMNSTFMSVTGDGLTCQKCNFGFYLSQNSCVLGRTLNCQIFDNNGVCLSCLFSYYLSNNLCIDNQNSIAIRDCLSPSSSNPNACNNCSFYSILVTVKNPCVLVSNPIQNCIKYSSIGLCITCASNYFLTQYSTCATYSPNNLCIIRNGAGVCQSCKQGYYLLGSSCLPILDIFNNNCKSTTTINNLPTCALCDINSLPVVLNGVYNVCFSPFTNNTFAIPPSIRLCAKTNQDSTCQQCISGFLLQDGTSICIQQNSCKTGTQLVQFRLINSILLPIGYNICSNVDFVANCSTYVPNYYFNSVNTTNNIVCIACRPGFMAVVPYSFSQAHIFDSPNNASDFTFRFAAINKCELISTVISTGTPVTFSSYSNCQSVLIDTINATYSYHGCYQCRFGFSGIPIRIYNKYFIKNCEPVPNCDSSVFYSGLSYIQSQLTKNGVFPHIPFNVFATCHRCMEANTIPFFGVVDSLYTVPLTSITIDVNSIIGFDMRLNIPSSIASSNGTSDNLLSCVNIDFLRSHDSIGTFPSNCGLAMALVNRAKSLYRSNSLSIMCIACRPGFYAIMLNSTAIGINYAVLTCTIIQNCQSSTRFSGCSICNPGFAFGYDIITSRPMFDTCLKSTPNCLYMHQNGTCAICQNGYIKHANMYCYIGDFKFCNNKFLRDFWVLSIFPGTIDPPIDFYQVYYGLTFPTGCNQCIQNYKNQMMSFNNQTICMMNTDLLSKPVDELFSIGLINHCLTYYWNNKLLCGKCILGYVVSTNGLTCFQLNPYLQNCTQANSSINCIICQNGFYFDNITNSCKIGFLQNCQIFASKTSCQNCSQGFFLSNGACLPFPDVNCTSFDIQSANMISCNQCRSFQFYSIDVSFAVCLRFSQPIDNCLTPNCSNYICTCSKCEYGYYLSSLQTVCIRSTPIYNCMLYSNTGDSCINCQDQFYLSANFSSCLPNPIGIANCLNYSTVNSCRLCSNGLILIDGLCKSVNNSTKVQNCLSHLLNSDGLLKCVACKSNYFLINNTCQIAIALNCLTYSNISTCGSCSIGFDLQLKSEIMSCVQIIIPNCYIYGRMSNKTICLTCFKRFYLYDLINCLPVDKFIMNCDTYSQNGVCNQCLSGFLLYYEGIACLPIQSYYSNLNSFCEIGKVDSTLTCGMCNLNYFFDQNGTCVKCGIQSGCMMCNPKNSTVCLVCFPGYFQDELMNCNKIGSGNGVQMLFLESKGFSKKSCLLVFFCFLGIYFFLK